MKILISTILFFGSVCYVSAQPGRFTPFTTDTSLARVLAEAKSKADFNHHFSNDAYWYFLDLELFREVYGKTNPSEVFDTLGTYSNGICDCMMKNDTIYLQGGIAYGGGMGFDIKIVKDAFTGKIGLSGKGYRTAESSSFYEDIVLNSSRQVMKLYSSDSLRFNSRLIGEVLLESEEYFEKDNPAPNKFFLKFLFDCKLDEAIAF